ncbi:FecR family protein [Carboxylicivirga sp. M1479]|uniref:FecR family protein n=1 Tax=Carboxylicivirga sp. M1479 TaxID=2594476 RepID=UPI00117857A8|nr:FecR domain-containing protein [Carboxylicivirga sp. M1479]TRX71419.1 DUF4974 domain-containing protein [Carboxylicivirga sp. M1479]
MEDLKYIYTLIYKQLVHSITDDEQSVVDNWRKQNSRNELLYQRVVDQKSINNSFNVYKSIDTDNAFNKVIAPAAIKRRLLPTFFKYAAAVVIPLLLGLSIWLISEQQQPNATISELIVPGSNKAMVVLSDGSTVELANESSAIVLEEDGKVVGKDSLHTLSYQHVTADKLIYNTLKIPYGGEYQMVLSDGTKVWLNSGSILKFPVNFISDTREVTLQGEAFFEVAHNADKPFMVHTKHSTTKVYGTSFNVMSYNNDKVEQVTLIEGKVGFSIKGQQTLLLPGQQAELALNNSNVVLKEVDASLYTSWKDGVLKFKNMPIKDLSKKLARWYDVDFYFANAAVGEIGFTGRVEKTTDFKHFMSLIEKTTNVKISINGRTVLVEEIN